MFLTSPKFLSPQTIFANPQNAILPLAIPPALPKFSEFSPQSDFVLVVTHSVWVATHLA